MRISAMLLGFSGGALTLIGAIAALLAGGVTRSSSGPGSQSAAVLAWIGRGKAVDAPSGSSA